MSSRLCMMTCGSRQGAGRGALLRGTLLTFCLLPPPSLFPPCTRLESRTKGPAHKFRFSFRRKAPMHSSTWRAVYLCWSWILTDCGVHPLAQNRVQSTASNESVKIRIWFLTHGELELDLVAGFQGLGF